MDTTERWVIGVERRPKDMVNLQSSLNITKSIGRCVIQFLSFSCSMICQIRFLKSQLSIWKVEKWTDILLISVKLLPCSDVKAFCLHHYDCMMVWLQVSMHSNPFFLSLKNSILDCFQWSWFTFCFFSSQLDCAKSFIVSELIQKWKGKL